MNTNSLAPRSSRLAACIILLLALEPSPSARALVLDDYNSGNIVVSSTTYGINQNVPGVLGGVRIIDFFKQDESSATSLTIGSGVVTFNATTAGDWFELFDEYVPGHTVDLTPYNAFQLIVLSAPAGSGYLTAGAGDPNLSLAGALASLPASGTGNAIFPFSWWEGSGVDFHNIYEVEVDFYAAVPGTYVFDNLQAVVVPEPTTLPLAGLGAAALMIFRRRQ